MKKVLFLIIFLGVSSLIRAQTTPQAIISDSVGKLVDSSKLSWNKVYNDVSGAMSAIGSALKVGAEHVYLILVKQQMVNAIIWIISFVFCIVFVCLMIKWGKGLHGRMIGENWNFDEEWGWIVLYVLLVAAIVGMLITCVSHIGAVVTGLINPEYGALNEILNKIYPSPSK